MARPRKISFEEEIQKYQEKLSKKEVEVKELKSKINSLKMKKAEHDYKDLLNYMQDQKITAEQVLDIIK